MRVIVDGKEMNIRAVWLEDKEKGIVKMIDQRYLPWNLKFFISKSSKETAMAIKKMIVRGAPTIGVTGAYAVYQAVIECINERNFIDILKTKVKLIQKTRPTAVNLFNITERMLRIIIKEYERGTSKRELIKIVGNMAEKLAEMEIMANKKIGEYGEKLIPDGSFILTHCNAGALAAVDVGTALAPIRVAHRKGKSIVVYVDETRPWLQGARLTAWELEMESIPYYLISDNAAGYFMWKKEIDLVIVGADRITTSGDVANKIGTYKLAVIAKENGIPFYVAAPLSTFDPRIKSGDEIPIEERGRDEVLYIRGYDESSNDLRRVLVSLNNARVRNPVFDVTPNKYITAIITEVGILRNINDIKRALDRLKSSNYPKTI